MVSVIERNICPRARFRQRAGRGPCRVFPDRRSHFRPPGCPARSRSMFFRRFACDKGAAAIIQPHRVYGGLGRVRIEVDWPLISILSATQTSQEALRFASAWHHPSSTRSGHRRSPPKCAGVNRRGRNRVDDPAPRRWLDTCSLRTCQCWPGACGLARKIGTDLFPVRSTIRGRPKRVRRKIQVFGSVRRKHDWLSAHHAISPCVQDRGATSCACPVRWSYRVSLPPKTRSGFLGSGVT